MKHSQLPWEALFVSVFDSAPTLSELKNTKNDTVKKQAVISAIMWFPDKGHGAFNASLFQMQRSGYLEFLVPVATHTQLRLMWTVVVMTFNGCDQALPRKVESVDIKRLGNVSKLFITAQTKSFT